MYWWINRLNYQSGILRPGYTHVHMSLIYIPSSLQNVIKIINYALIRLKFIFRNVSLLWETGWVLNQYNVIGSFTLHIVLQVMSVWWWWNWIVEFWQSNMFILMWLLIFQIILLVFVLTYTLRNNLISMIRHYGVIRVHTITLLPLHSTVIKLPCEPSIPISSPRSDSNTKWHQKIEEENVCVILSTVCSII